MNQVIQKAKSAVLKAFQSISQPRQIPNAGLISRPMVSAQPWNTAGKQITPVQAVAKSYVNDFGKTLGNIGLAGSSLLQASLQPLANQRTNRMLESLDLAKKAAQATGPQKELLLQQSRGLSNQPNIAGMLSQNLAEINLAGRQKMGLEGTGIKTFLKGAAPAANIALTGKGGQALGAMPLIGKATTLGTSALLSGGMGAISGQNPLQAAAAGILKTPRLVGITGITSPLVKYGASGIMDKFATPLARNIVGRGLTGLGNVIEDEFISKLDGYKPGLSDRVLSFGIGALLAPTKEYEAYLQSEEPSVRNKIKQISRDIRGRFAKDAGINTKSLDYMVEDPNSRQMVLRSKLDAKVPGVMSDLEKLNKYLEIKTGGGGNIVRSIRDEQGNLIKPKELEPVFQRGDITKIGNKIDELLGTDNFNFSGKWQNQLAARETAMESLMEGVKAGDEQSIDTFRQIKQLENNLSTAREFNDNPKLLSEFKKEFGTVVSGTDEFPKGYLESQYGATLTKPPKGLTPEVKRNAYEIKTQSGIQRVEGKPIEIVKGIETFLSKDSNGNWTVNEKTTGRTLTQGGYPTEKAAIEDAKGLIDYMGIDKVKAQIESLKKSGLTPEVTTKTPTIKLKGETPQPIKLTQKVQEPIVPNLKTSQLNISSNDIIPPATGIGRRAPQEINVSNLDLTKPQKIEIQKATAKTVTDTLSNQEIKKIAESAGFDTKTYTTEQTAQKIAEQLNVRRQVVELENQLTEMRKSGASVEDIASQLKKVADQAEVSSKQGTDIARQLQARRILANEIDTPMQKIFKVLDEAGVNRDVYVKKAAKEGIDFNNAQQTLKFYRELVPAKASEWIDLLRYNSMLSSPNTFINNLSSNFQGTGIIAPIEKTVTGLVDKLYSGITGKPRQYFTGEGAAYAKGYYSNLKKATQSFLDVMKGNDTQLGSSLDVRQAPLATTGVEKKIYEHLSYPMKLLEGTDKFFRTLTSGGAEEAFKYKLKKGAKVGIDVKDLAMQEAEKRLFISQLGVNEGSKALDAIDSFANLVQKAKSSKNPIVSTISKFTLPFVRTPTNILKQGLEYSPFGVSTMWGSQHKTEQVAKALMGTSVGLAAATLVANDHITWAEPTSEKQRNAFRAAGMQPYAVKIGDNWVSYSKLHPAVAFPLAAVAAIKNAQDNKRLTESQTDTLINGISKWVNFFVDQSYVKSIGDMVSGLKGNASDLSRIPTNYLSQLIPWRAMASWLNRLVDPVQRQADPDGSILDRQLQNIASQIPLLSYSVPARLDQMGNPIKNTNATFNAFSPVGKITTENPEMKQQYLDIMEKSKLTKQKADLKSMIKSGQDVSGLEVSAAETSLPKGMSKDQLDIAKLKFEMSDMTSQKLNDSIYFIKNDSGTISTIDISKPINKPTLTGQTEIDKKLNSQYNSKIESRVNNLIKLVENNQMEPSKAEEMIGQLRSLKTTTKKVSTKKAKKPKKITIKKIALKKVSVPKIKQIKIKQFKIPKAKIVKLGKLKQPKMIKLKTIKYKK